MSPRDKGRLLPVYLKLMGAELLLLKTCTEFYPSLPKLGDSGAFPGRVFPIKVLIDSPPEQEGVTVLTRPSLRLRASPRGWSLCRLGSRHLLGGWGLACGQMPRGLEADASPASSSLPSAS